MCAPGLFGGATVLGVRGQAAAHQRQRLGSQQVLFFNFSSQLTHGHTRLWPHAAPPPSVQSGAAQSPAAFIQ